MAEKRRRTYGTAETGRLRASANENNTGWVLSLYSPEGSDAGSSAANVTLAEAERLVELVRAGGAPGDEFRARGMVHDLKVTPAVDRTGWVIYCWSFGAAASITLTHDEMLELSDVLTAGPGPVIYGCEKHKKLGSWCLDCLTGEDDDEE